MLYIKKPIPVKAVKFTYDTNCLLFLAGWMKEAMGESKKDRHPDAKGELQIKTLEDGDTHFKVKHIATEGDYIVQGFAGEFWAVKPHIFEQTYEPVGQPTLEEQTMEKVLLEEVKWLKNDYARLRLESNPDEDKLLHQAYAEQAIEHFKFVLAYFDAKYDKL